MAANLGSPLSQLVMQAVGTVTSRLNLGEGLAGAEQVGGVVEQVAGDLLNAIGLREVADDLDIESISLLTAASIVGLKVLDLAEPGIYRVKDALDTLEDLLRRTAERGAR